MTFSEFLNQMALNGVGVAAGARRAYVLVVSQGMHLLAGDKEKQLFVVYHDGKLCFIPRVCVAFDELSAEQQHMARQKWSDAANGDGFLYLNYNDDKVDLNSAIVSRIHTDKLSTAS